jgi:hypothetical protein
VFFFNFTRNKQWNVRSSLWSRGPPVGIVWCVLRWVRYHSFAGPNIGRHHHFCRDMPATTTVVESTSGVWKHFWTTITAGLGVVVVLYKSSASQVFVRYLLAELSDSRRRQWFNIINNVLLITYMFLNWLEFRKNYVWGRSPRMKHFLFSQVDMLCPSPYAACNFIKVSRPLLCRDGPPETQLKPEGPKRRRARRGCWRAESLNRALNKEYNNLMPCLVIIIIYQVS